MTNRFNIKLVNNIKLKLYITFLNLITSMQSNYRI